MQKPSGVTLSTIIMAVFIVIGLALAFITPIPSMNGLPVSPAALLTMVHMMGIFSSLVAAVVVWFYFQGQNWARWIVMVISVFSILGLLGLMKNWHISHLSGCLILGKAILAIYLLWYLNTPMVKAWYEKRIHAEA